MFEWLFNYPASSWREATLGFASGLPVWLLIAAIVLALLFSATSLWRQPLSAPRRSVLLALQFSVAGIILTMLWQPVLQLAVAEQGENTVAWVVDNSRSMQTDDVPADRSSTSAQQSRLSAAQDTVQRLAVDSSSEFAASLYAQTDTLLPLASPDQLDTLAPSAVTDIAGGLDELLGTLTESALAAVVLVSDGADNADSMDAQWWQRLSAAGVPVHTVGVGRIVDPFDLQLSDVSLPEQVAPEVQISARLTVGHSRGGSARVRVLSGRDLIAAEDIELPENVTQSMHEVSLPTGVSGIKQLRFELVSNDELMDPDTSNNEQQRVLRVAEAPKRILYVEGEPRWEFKFIRRALDDLPGIELVSLLRTSPNKYYRQGVRDASELADGFPVERDALFSYDAIIIGSLEAAQLSTAQQLSLRDFVSVRGGSLLMLAGRQGLSDGGWGRSVLAAALPVTLDARLSAQTFVRERAQALPTLAGFRTPWLSLGDSPQDNIAAWQSLPAIADVQSLGPVKPGAVVLLERSTQQTSGSGFEPLLVSQRYGKGQSMVIGTSGTWRWQMGLDSTDQRHELFWQQLAATLVEAVVPRISVVTDRPVYRDLGEAAVTVTAYTAEYEPLQQAELTIQVTQPDGTVATVQLPADTQQAGTYSGRVPMDTDGPYTVNAMSPLGGESPQSALATTEHWWVKESGTAESFDNVQQNDLLQRIADATGGSYMTLTAADDLLDVLAQKNAALKREVSLPLWNMPALFLLLLLAKLAEWSLRLRWRRL